MDSGASTAPKRQRRGCTIPQIKQCLDAAGVEYIKTAKKDNLLGLAEKHGVDLRAAANQLGLSDVTAGKTGMDSSHEDDSSLFHLDSLSTCDLPLDLLTGPVTDLPQDLLKVLVTCVAANVTAADAPLLFNLALTCKDLQTVINEDGEDSKIWKSAWHGVWGTAKDTITRSTGTSTQKVKLLAFKDCQLCKRRPQTRKVYWLFMVRCCSDCLHASTVSDKDIRKETDIPLMECFKRVPFNATRMWNRWMGEYTGYFFWAKALTPLMQRYHGVSTMAELLQKKEEAAAATQAKRDKERAAKEAEKASKAAERRAKTAEKKRKAEERKQKAAGQAQLKEAARAAKEADNAARKRHIELAKLG